MAYPKFSLRGVPDPNSVMGQMPVAAGPKQGLLARLQDKFMPAPSGGLLTDEDVKNARMQGLLGFGASLLADSGPHKQGTAPGLMQSIGRGIQAGQGAYQGAQQQAVGMRGAEQQVKLGEQNLQLNDQKLAAGQAEQAQAAQLAAGRKAIFEKYGQPDMADPKGTAAWLDAVMPELMAIGDTETLGRFSEVRKTLGDKASAKEPGQWVEVTGPDGKPMTRYVTASEAGQGLPVYEKPQRDTNEEMTVNSRFLNEERLLKGHNTRIDGIQTTVDAYIGAKRAEKMGGSGDLQILYSFIKALDPGSVVREGEVALAREAASYWSQAHIWKSKLETQGGTLSPIQREQMLKLMKQMVDLKAERAARALKDGRSRAERFGLEVELHDPMEKYRAFEKIGQQPPPNTVGPLKGGYGTPSVTPGNVGSLREKYGSIR